jgi:hypothetical protein
VRHISNLSGKQTCIAIFFLPKPFYLKSLTLSSRCAPKSETKQKGLNQNGTKLNANWLVLIAKLASHLYFHDIDRLSLGDAECEQYVSNTQRSQRDQRINVTNSPNSSPPFRRCPSSPGAHFAYCDAATGSPSVTVETVLGFCSTMDDTLVSFRNSNITIWDLVDRGTVRITKATPIAYFIITFNSFHTFFEIL